MSTPKKKRKSLRRQVRQVEDDLNVDRDVEEVVDGILSLFDDDDDDDDEDDEGDSFDSSDEKKDDFGGGDFGGGGSSSDW